MANSILTINQITRKAIQLFRNSNAFLKMVSKQYDDSFGVTGAKIGQSLRIRLPNDYTVRVGQTMVLQDTTEKSVTLPLATQVGVDVPFTSAERLLSMDDYADRVLSPMINNLTGAIASDIMSGSLAISNYVHNVDGSNNTLSPTATTWLAAGAILDQMGCPRDDRNIIIDPLTMSRTVSSLSGLFNAQDKIGAQYSKGLIAQNVLGADWSLDQSVLVTTAGTFTAGTINGANQTGTTLVTNATTGTLKIGDIITIAGVVSANRVNKASTGVLQQFVVTANAASGATSISVYPSLNPQVASANVAYQTVVASPANSAAITLVQKPSEVQRRNFMFAPQAITMVTADLQLPTSAVQAAHREAYSGISIRCIDDYLTQTDQWVTRTDVLYGYCYVRPEWCVVVGDAV